MPVFTGSIDQSILASSLPTIGRVFGDVHDLPWLITSYLIAATALTPLYGKFADIHGRRVSLLIALGIYMVGSLVSATSTSMLMLIGGRIVQGCGGGGLVTVSQMVLGDIAPPQGPRQVLRLFLHCLHQCGRLWAGSGRLDLPALALVADLSVAISVLPGRGGARLERAAPVAALRPAAPARCDRRGS